MARLVAEVAVAVAAADLGGVVPARLAAAVGLQVSALRHGELPGQRRHDAGRHVAGILQEHAKVPDGAELQGQTELVVVATALSDQGTVGVVEVERARQVGGRRLAVVAPVGRFLSGGEEGDGHQ